MIGRTVNASCTKWPDVQRCERIRRTTTYIKVSISEVYSHNQAVGLLYSNMLNVAIIGVHVYVVICRVYVGALVVLLPFTS